MASFISPVADIVKALFGRISDDNRELLESISKGDKLPIELAFAIILCDLALIDQNFHVREYEYIFTKFKSVFGLKQDEVQGLIKKAGSYLASMHGTHSLAVKLNEELNDEQRKTLLEMIEGLIDADDHRDGFEIYLRNKFADLLSGKNA